MMYIVVSVFSVAVLIFVVFGVIIVYHLARYRFVGDASLFMMTMYILVAGVILTFSTLTVLRTNWDTYNISVGPSAPTQPTSHSLPLFSR